jgi:hypothetical protein
MSVGLDASRADSKTQPDAKAVVCPLAFALTPLLVLSERSYTMFNHRFLPSPLTASASLLAVLVTVTCSALAQEKASLPAAAEPVPAAAPAPVVAAEPAPAVTEPAAASTEPAPVATEPAPAAVGEAPPPAAAKPKPPPYSLPWQLRPIAPGNVIRLDTAFGFYKNPTSGESGAAQATSLLGSYKIIPDLALIARVGLVHNSPPEPVAPATGPGSATSILNPVLGALYGIKLSPDFKLGLFLGFTLPVGSGGGTNPDVDKAAANQAGILTRSAMDNAMFAVNYFTVFPGVGFAFVRSGFTAQVEATILQLTKTRGPDSADDSNTNFTTGLHVGYFVLPMLSLGAEIRHQRWLSTPTAVKTNSAARDTTTFAVGPRFHFKLSEKVWFRPGVALVLPIDEPMTTNDFKIVQLDLPLSF